MPSSDLPRDPLNLESVDRAININELEARLESMGMRSARVSDDCPPKVHEQFLKSVLSYESAPVSCRFTKLVNAGVELPKPDTLDDAALHAKLWEVVRALAKQDVYLERTDHLSDRQMYEHLWSNSLREEGPMMPAGSGWVCHLDILGGCSDEDIKLGQRYYDSEETRQRWAKDFPDDVIPPHEAPPFQRDRLLPKPPAPEMRRGFDESDEDGDEL